MPQEQPGDHAILRLTAAAPARRGEPATCGVPWPRGVLRDVAALALRNESGELVPFQARPLDLWPDGSVRWSLLDWQATVDGSSIYHLGTRNIAAASCPSSPVRVETNGEAMTIDTGVARFELRAGAFPFATVLHEGRQLLASGSGFTAEDEAGRIYRPRCRTPRVETAGPLRAMLRFNGELVAEGVEPLVELTAFVHFFAGSPTVRFDLTLRNPRKAEHPGGLWDLGNGGSVYLRDVSLRLVLPPHDGQSEVSCSLAPGSPYESAASLELVQGSSGGENWASHNHLSRSRRVPYTSRGFRCRFDGQERTGDRATPTVVFRHGPDQVAVAMASFWQNFPKAIEADSGGLVLGLFPRQIAEAEEMQGGEQKTHTFFVAFGPDAVTHEPLAWCRSPLLAHADPAWYCASGALPYLTPRLPSPPDAYETLVSAAIEGTDTFERKREVIDEYGWRHFGELYGDHEAVFHKGPEPLVSHFNNQYDVIAGLGYQFCRTGDARWFKLMDEMAWHVQDIDIYHTDRDKAAYNHGLFWHTYHYVDADTGTHRSYPRSAGVCGGGPGNEQNYTTGLMLFHFLTGSPSAREAALGLARWVIDMDDGGKTVFRWLAGGATGLASTSRTPTYHGPGRGSANSVAALLDGHRLTGDPVFLLKAEELIRRVIHPADNVPARNLLDAENRWFYTMFLQALGRYLTYKAQRDERDRMYAYARASLLHYARWMADHEYPYLDKPEILEYPTETWAAQDIRKSDIFYLAAMLAVGEERARFLERAGFFFRSSTESLSAMKTRTLARPVVLLLANGLMQSWFRAHPDASLPPPAEKHGDHGRPQVFVPQKQRALRRARMLAGIAVAAAGAVAAGLLLWLLL